LCEKILYRLDNNDETFTSVIGTYAGIRAFIKELMAYDEVDFDSLVISDPEYENYYDAYVVDIRSNDGEILFCCEPAKRDGKYINFMGDVLYLLDGVKQAVLNTCEYDEMYFVIIGEDEYENDCNECCVECSKTENGDIHGFTVSKSDDNGYYSFSFYSSDVLGDDTVRRMLDKHGF
jgi:hypothetical protein